MIWVIPFFLSSPGFYSTSNVAIKGVRGWRFEGKEKVRDSCSRSILAFRARNILTIRDLSFYFLPPTSNL
jgi:hypothetical protein